MQINLPETPVQVQGTSITFVLDDKGGAHVKLILSIAGFPPIQHDETYQGSKTVTINIPKGTHECSILIAAFKYGALNAHYASSVTANGILLASANGNIPQGKGSEIGVGYFQLVAN